MGHGSYEGTEKVGHGFKKINREEPHLSLFLIFFLVIFFIINIQFWHNIACIFIDYRFQLSGRQQCLIRDDATPSTYVHHLSKDTVSGVHDREVHKRKLCIFKHPDSLFNLCYSHCLLT